MLQLATFQDINTSFVLDPSTVFIILLRFWSKKLFLFSRQKKKEKRKKKGAPLLFFSSCGGRPVQVKRLRGSRSVSVPVLFSRNFEFALACLQKFFWSEISAGKLRKKARERWREKKKPFVLLIIASKDEKEKRRREEREEREKNERGKER